MRRAQRTTTDFVTGPGSNGNMHIPARRFIASIQENAIVLRPGRGHFIAYRVVNGTSASAMRYAVSQIAAH